MADLTAIILTKNEEMNIAKCINSLRSVAKRIVIVDSFSSDRTKEICISMGTEFYENSFINYATQFNWALKNTNVITKWTLRIDADEELTEELAKEINLRLDSLKSNINGIVIKVRVYFLGKWIKHGAVYPLSILRIFKTGMAECEKKDMDEHIILRQGETIAFEGDLIHNNFKDLDWWTHKHNWYSNREVIDYFNIKKSFDEISVKPKIFAGQAERKRWLKNKLYLKTPLFKRAKWYFLYRYIFRLGFLDGKEGLIFHFLQGFWYRFLVDAKIFECQKTNKVYTNQGDLK